MKKMLFLGMAALLIQAGCASKEQKAAQAEIKAAADLLEALQKNDTPKLEEYMGAMSPDLLASRLAANHSSPVGDFTYELNEAGDGIVLKKYSGEGGVVVIPAEIEGYPVVEIRSVNKGYASVRGPFTKNDDITSVVVPPSVKEIPEAAFALCENLTTVILPDTVEEIGLQAFIQCTSLQTVNFPAGLKTIGYQAFGGCGELYNLTIPDSLTALSWESTLGRGRSGAFLVCGKLPLKTRQRLKDLGYTDSF
jgi:hypothetical protein